MITATEVAADFVKGVAAGILATWVMGKVTSAVYGLESDSTRKQEEAGWQEGKPAFVNAARQTADAVGYPLEEEQKQRAGSLAHWGLGAIMGGIYGVTRRRVSGVGAAQGLLFGMAFFLLVDEAMNWAFGFTKGPTHFPWQAHARGLVGHLAYGVAAETTLDALDRIA